MKKVWAVIGVLLVVAVIGTFVAWLSPGKYETAADLREDFVDAGGQCEDWEPATVAGATDSIACGTSTLLSVFEDEAAAGEHAVTRSIMGEALELDVDVLDGTNWVIVGSDLEDVAEALGGELR